MKTKILISVVFFLSVNFSIAIDKRVEKALGLVKQEKYKKAEKNLKSILKKNKKIVDAWMLLGNIEFYKNSNFKNIQIFGNQDESIYDNSIGHIGEGESYLTKKACKKIEKYFLKALEVDKNRIDIQKGLCYALANSGQKDKLIKRFYILKKLETNPNLAYNFGDYARIIIKRNNFEDGISIYKVISELFPKNGNILNDIGAAYFNEGNLSESISYFDNSLKFNTDQKTIFNVILINSILGNFSKNLLLLKNINDNEFKTFYKSLYKLLDTGEFIISKKSKKYSKAILLLNNNNNISEKDLLDIMKLDLNGSLQFLILNIGNNLFPKSEKLIFYLADYLTYYKNFKLGEKYYSKIKSKTYKKIEKYKLYRAFNYYKLKQFDKSSELFFTLLNSENITYKCTAHYFTGNIYLNNNRKVEAINTFKAVTNYASKSKHANICRLKLFGL